MEKFLNSIEERFVMAAIILLFVDGPAYVILQFIDIFLKVDLMQEVSAVLMVLYTFCLMNMVMALFAYYLRVIFYGSKIA